MLIGRERELGRLDEVLVGVARGSGALVLIVGAGHMHQVEVPDQVNAMIDRFLAIDVPQT